MQSLRKGTAIPIDIVVAALILAGAESKLAIKIRKVLVSSGAIMASPPLIFSSELLRNQKKLEKISDIEETLFEQFDNKLKANDILLKHTNFTFSKMSARAMMLI